MGNLVIIVNHTKKMYICPVMKFRELLLNHYGDYLICLLQKSDIEFADLWWKWNNDAIEIVSDAQRVYFDNCREKYRDMTKEVEDLFKDQIEKDKRK